MNKIKRTGLVIRCLLVFKKLITKFFSNFAIYGISNTNGVESVNACAAIFG